jgi:hypothetical protein
MTYSSKKHYFKTIKDFSSTHIRFVLLFISILWLLACSGRTEEPPGTGIKANQGYAACNYIIAVLEDYKSAKGTYPASLEDLVPGYASSIPTEVNGQPIVYSKSDEDYTLSFSYIGPGMNYCTYSTEDGRKWRCSGAH